MMLKGLEDIALFPSSSAVLTGDLWGELQKPVQICTYWGLRDTSMFNQPQINAQTCTQTHAHKKCTVTLSLRLLHNDAADAQQWIQTRWPGVSTARNALIWLIRLYSTDVLRDRDPSKLCGSYSKSGKSWISCWRENDKETRAQVVRLQIAPRTVFAERRYATHLTAA